MLIYSKCNPIRRSLEAVVKESIHIVVRKQHKCTHALLQFVLRHVEKQPLPQLLERLSSFPYEARKRWQEHRRLRQAE